MLNVFTIVGKAWDFKKSQPVLNAVLLWFIFLPMAALLLLGAYLEQEPSAQITRLESVLAGEPGSSLYVGIAFLHVVIIVLLLWGTACTTLVGKRLLQSRAGRARTSFKVVRKQAIRFVANLFLTDILRGCITILWALLLFIPGIIYQIRTHFYFIAIVCEGKEYRESLEHSKKTVKGQTWTAFKYILSIFIVVFFPLILVDTSVVQLAYTFTPQLIQVTYIISAYLYSLGLLLFLLSSIVLYAELKNAQRRT